VFFADRGEPERGAADVNAALNLYSGELAWQARQHIYLETARRDDVFERGAPEPLVIETQKEYGDTLLDLLKAYASRRQRKMVHQIYTVKKQQVWSIKEARETLERLLGAMEEWGTFDRWLEKYFSTPETRRSVRDSSFTASLELAREGVIEIRQDQAFQPIFLRRRNSAA
jgi:segregation and condensation protein A